MHQRRRGVAALGQSVVAVAEEFQQAEVAKDLKLLADFGADVLIGGMEFGQFRFE